MYNGIKSYVSHGGDVTECFPCNIGVRQGENLSPFLFALYINDLEQYLQENNCDDLSCLRNIAETKLDMFLKLFVLLYADDTILMAESEKSLQNALNVFGQYCLDWKLKVNFSKTKVIIFSKRHVNKLHNFTLFGNVIEITKEYVYLGILFTNTGRFLKAQKRLCEQASRAMFSIFRKCRLLELPMDCKLKLFDQLVKPILLYGSEVWGFESSLLIERMHLKFCKYILGLKLSTPDFFVYGELGRHPLYIYINIRIVCFWANLILPKNYNKLSSIMFRIMYKLQLDGDVKFVLIESIKSVLYKCGLNNVWDQQLSPSVTWIKCNLHRLLVDQFNQTWRSRMTDSSKGNYYNLYKHVLLIEDYTVLLPKDLRIVYTKFRTCNHRLPIETGRWHNIDRDNRMCNFCNQCIGDEYHFLLCCPSLQNLRNLYLPPYYCKYPSIDKFVSLMSTKYLPLIVKTATFIKHGMRMLP
jgi:hypothetical protein